MANELVNASSRAVSNPSENPFAAQGSEGTGVATTYVKFTGATGLFTAGQDDDEIEHGTRFAADMMNAQWVWSFWWDGKVLEQFSDALTENPMSYDNPPMELPDDPNGDIDMSIEEIMQAQKDDPANFRDGWSVQASLNLRPLDGSDDDYTIKLNKGVAMNSFHVLRKSFGRQYKLKAGLVPIIELSANSYEPKAKSAGKKRWAPTLKIVGWMSEEALMGIAGDDPADYDDEPAQTSAPAEAPAETEASEEKAPAARRGRRGARGANLG